MSEDASQADVIPSDHEKVKEAKHSNHVEQDDSSEYKDR
jgi:hypothetical protein